MAKIKKMELGDQVLTVSIHGDLYGGPDDMNILDKVVDRVKEEKKKKKIKKVYLDINKVKWISATGMGILVSLRSRIMKNHSVEKVILTNPNKRVLDYLETTRLNLTFGIESD